jgi:periplasmic divalent cation tolerance protein
MTRFVQVTTTTGSEADARMISRTLVERRLAACVQIIGPITSVYRWRGEIETAREWLCVAKSGESLFAAIERAIRDVHPYEVPEILSTPVTGGSAGYLAWMEDNLKGE